MKKKRAIDPRKKWQCRITFGWPANILIYAARMRAFTKITFYCTLFGVKGVLILVGQCKESEVRVWFLYILD